MKKGALEMHREISRRDFIKTAGIAAGLAAVKTSFPLKLFAAENAAAPFSALSISRPAFIAPELVAAGAGIPFAKSEAADISISAVFLGGKNGEKIPLSQASSSLLQPGKTPAPGMYDIILEYTKIGEAKTERQPNAVKIVDSFKKDFVFGVISDVHFGDTRIKAKDASLDPPATFKKEIDILNSRGVEFCLCCGDICFIPPKTKKELLDYAEMLYSNASFPVFSVPGNHDGYATGAGGRIQYDTYTQWEKYFGPKYFSASYGDITLLGINTFEKEPIERNMYGGYGEELDTGVISDKQLAWLESEMKKARADNPSGTIILFGHHNPTNTVADVNGPFSIVPFTERGRKGLLSLLEKYSPEYMFIGHVHGVHEETYAKTKILTVPTATSLPAQNQPLGFYIVTVKNGKPASCETVEIARV